MNTPVEDSPMEDEVAKAPAQRAQHRIRIALVLILALLCLLPMVKASWALIAGACIGLIIGNPMPARTGVWSKELLKIVVIGLGFGLSAQQVITVGGYAIVYTIIGIALTILLGIGLRQVLKTDRETSILITTGTAICGGSAIAALSPVIRADQHHTAVALATVFTLNAIALLLFPPIGALLDMTQPGFATWAAIAIHDTSSVVAACEMYGSEAGLIGTAIKLTRALWIIPLVLIAGLIWHSDKKAKFPLFLLGFIGAAVLRTLLPSLDELWDALRQIAGRVLVVTIFFIGCGLTRQTIGRVGPRPLLLGVVLWAIVSVGTLLAILSGLVPAVTL